MIKINLLPKDVQEKGKGFEWVILGCALTALLLLTGITSHLLQRQAYNKDLAKKERWLKQLPKIKEEVSQVEQLDGQKSLLNAKKNTVVMLLQGRLLYPKLMETFFETLPKDVWITNLTLAEDAQKNITVVAASNALSVDAIAEWLQTLESKPGKFSSVILSAILSMESTTAKQSYYGFSMTFTYTPPPLENPGA